MKVYLSNFQTFGYELYQKKIIQKFAETERRLIAKGYEVMNPATLYSIDPKLNPYHNIRNDLRDMLKCDVMLLVDFKIGWKLSGNSIVETQVARLVSMPVFENEDDLISFELEKEIDYETSKN